ncbi:diguanylate cyclase (GGDEF) domain-containing protein [Treponema bryantii]|uniref:Diguanylate cyclase (GGDEF) domain-containing protein n=1 Tax=Treponema bryantii TaxID=163 RepID=A0A1I3KWJ8_9SPIR|nr:GGDEF domain-containing protein [Treponema bryantii]SFI76718.1 diguanylate cyclase (GGDEF) domain-containing protein [Treponema bryantii]
MKVIAVLIPTFTIEYSLDVLSGISDYFRGKDAKVVIIQTRIPGINTGAFDYQYCTGFEYAKSKEIDGVICVSGIYASQMSEDKLREMLKLYEPRPIVSIALDPQTKNGYAIQADCRKSFKDIVSHLKKEHGCQKIAFFSANETKSKEALERYDAFTAALDASKLTFYPEMVYDGNFTDFKAHDEIISRFKSRNEIPFDAIVCANDMMASGCMRAFDEIGVRVPEDVKVIGFDDAIVASMLSPKLSTINQDIYSQGYEAAEMVDRLLDGEKMKKEIFNPLVPKFRQSCGCIGMEHSIPAYKNVDGDICSDLNDKTNGVMQFVNALNEKNAVVTLLDTIRGFNTLKQMFFNLKYITSECALSGIAIHFFKDVQIIDSEQEFVLPDEAELHMFYSEVTNTEIFRPGLSVDPHEKIFSARSMDDISGIFLLNPIFIGETYYGYILCRIKENKFADYNVYLKIIMNAVAQAYEYTSKLQEGRNLERENTDLALQSRMDELTGILNRRGFIEQGQAALDLLQETDTSGVIFFADMDGLKKINDTYGHEMGDKAIMLQARVLKDIFRSSDVVGRLSGDEFGIVALGMKMNYVENTKLKIDLLCKKVSIENQLPFTLSVSLGAVDLQKSSVLKKLLSQADKELYKEKKKKHARQ